MGLLLAVGLGGATVGVGGLAPAAAQAAGDYERVVDIVFPVSGSVTFADTYDAVRGAGNGRRHQATDLFAPKGRSVVAAVGGRVCWLPGVDGPPPAYGYMVAVCGDDGRTYNYVHLNNDTPGTDDGRGGPAAAYAPGLRSGSRVARGQVVGYVGDSGNAEDTPPHVHFEIVDPRLDDPRIRRAPYRPDRLNPYPSLVAARAGGAGSGGVLRRGDRGPAVADWQGQLNRAVAAGLPTNGVFGPATQAATVRFQRARDLTADGVVGPATRRVMAAVLAAAPVRVAGDAWPGRVLRLADPPMRGDDVRAWQERMRARGWRDSRGQPLAVDGVYGAESVRVCRLLQERRGLPVDGAVGPATWDAVEG